MIYQNSVLFSNAEAPVTKMAEKIVKMILDGENINMSNDQSPP